MTPKKKKTWNDKVPIISFVVGSVSLVLAIILAVNTIFFQRPLNSELAQVKEDFPVTQYYYEATKIAKSIPLPEDNSRNLNYMTLIDFNDQNPGSFLYPRFILRLNTDYNMYLATNSQNSTAKVVFTIEELRMNRGTLFWRLYPNGQAFPPTKWSS
jgi:hypothetical protein